MEKSKSRGWIVFITVMLQSVFVMMCMYQVPPNMGALIEEFGLSMTSAGWLMSMFAMVGIVMAFPAAGILNKLGPKISGAIPLICAVVGSFLGAVATSGTTLFISRVIEGIGVGLVGVVAPAVISMWFAPEKRSVPMGIWTNYVPLGMTIMYNLAVPVSQAYTWRGCWWLTAILCAVALVLYLIFVDAPGKKDKNSVQMSDTPEMAIESPWKALRSPTVWILGFAYLFYNINAIAYYAWGPTYFSTVLGQTAAWSNTMTSAMGFAGIASAVICGIVMVKVKNRKAILVPAIIVYTVLIYFSYRVGVGFALPFVIIFGLVNGILPSSINIMAPDSVVKPTQIGVAMAVIGGFCCNIGQTAASPLFGAIIDGSGWNMASIVQVVVSVITLAFIVILKMPKRELQINN